MLLEDTLGEQIEQLMEKSVDFAKNYVAILSFNFSVEVDTNFDLDIVLIRNQVLKA